MTEAIEIDLQKGGMPIPEMPWNHFSHEMFQAEWAVRGDDVVYHFFPPAGQKSFRDPIAFAKRVEKAFVKVYPRWADVRAEVISGDAARLAAPLGELTESGNARHPVEDVLHITAMGWGKRLGATEAGQRLMKCVREEMLVVG